MQRGILVAVVVLVVLAGCNGGGGGERTPEAIEANATQATVSDGALSNAGFAGQGVEQVRVNRSGTLSISGDVQMDLTYQVEATGWRATYRPSGGSSPGTVVAVYTLPLAKPENVAATIDPAGDESLATIVGQAQGVYAAPESLERVRNRSASVLGTTATVQQYRGTASTGGQSTDVTVFVTVVEHGGDVVRAVAVAPRGSADWSTVRTLFEGISH